MTYEGLTKRDVDEMGSIGGAGGGGEREREMTFFLERKTET